MHGLQRKFDRRSTLRQITGIEVEEPGGSSWDEGVLVYLLTITMLDTGELH